MIWTKFRLMPSRAWRRRPSSRPFPAPRKRRAWVYDPLQVALRLVGDFEGRSQSITRIHDSADTPRAAEVIVIEDGYLDDSVRGARYHITLESDQGVWRPTAVARGWRCWPGRGHETFAKQPCL